MPLLLLVAGGLLVVAGLRATPARGFALLAAVVVLVPADLVVPNGLTPLPTFVRVTALAVAGGAAAAAPPGLPGDTACTSPPARYAAVAVVTVGVLLAPPWRPRAGRVLRRLSLLDPLLVLRRRPRRRSGRRRRAARAPGARPGRGGGGAARPAGAADGGVVGRAARQCGRAARDPSRRGPRPGRVRLRAGLRVDGRGPDARVARAARRRGVLAEVAVVAGCLLAAYWTLQPVGAAGVRRRPRRARARPAATAASRSVRPPRPSGCWPSPWRSPPLGSRFTADVDLGALARPLPSGCRSSSRPRPRAPSPGSGCRAPDCSASRRRTTASCAPTPRPASSARRSCSSPWPAGWSAPAAACAGRAAPTAARAPRPRRSGRPDRRRSRLRRASRSAVRRPCSGCWSRWGSRPPSGRSGRARCCGRGPTRPAPASLPSPGCARGRRGAVRRLAHAQRGHGPLRHAAARAAGRAVRPRRRGTAAGDDGLRGRRPVRPPGAASASTAATSTAPAGAGELRAQARRRRARRCGAGRRGGPGARVDAGDVAAARAGRPGHLGGADVRAHRRRLAAARGAAARPAGAVSPAASPPRRLRARAAGRGAWTERTSARALRARSARAAGSRSSGAEGARRSPPAERPSPSVAMPSAPDAVVSTRRRAAAASSTLTFGPARRRAGERQHGGLAEHLASRSTSPRPRRLRVADAGLAASGQQQPRTRHGVTSRHAFSSSPRAAAFGAQRQSATHARRPAPRRAAAASSGIRHRGRHGSRRATHAATRSRVGQHRRAAAAAAPPGGPARPCRGRRPRACTSIAVA